MQVGDGSAGVVEEGAGDGGGGAVEVAAGAALVLSGTGRQARVALDAAGGKEPRPLWLPPTTLIQSVINNCVCKSPNLYAL